MISAQEWVDVLIKNKLEGYTKNDMYNFFIDNARAACKCPLGWIEQDIR